MYSSPDAQSSPHAEQAPQRQRAPGKVNLTLRVVGRRGDGYHEIESLMVLIGVCDELVDVGPSDSGFRLSCDRDDLPTDERNLVVQTARLLAERRGRPIDRAVHLHKRIPVGAGLGGGSSDAAAALLLLNRVCHLGLTRQELTAWAPDLGSDVPFFLHPPAAVVRGRGERVAPAEICWPGYLLLVFPPVTCATPAVYARWKQPEHRADAPINPLTAGAAPSAATLAEQLFNDLELPAFEAYPDLRRWHARVQEICRRPARLSGSGSTLFVLADDLDEARALRVALAACRELRTEITQLADTIALEET
jgi:4-diphosphocytidyl-2-C-methyl-D-erythritol kinase